MQSSSLPLAQIAQPIRRLSPRSALQSVRLGQGLRKGAFTLARRPSFPSYVTACYIGS